MTAVVRGHSSPIAEPERFLRGPVTFVINGDHLTEARAIKVCFREDFRATSGHRSEPR